MDIAQVIKEVSRPVRTAGKDDRIIIHVVEPTDGLVCGQVHLQLHEVLVEEAGVYRSY